MDHDIKGQVATLALFLASMAAVMLIGAGCIRLISAEQLEDGSAVMCVRIEPTDAGADAVPSPEPAMRYVPGASVELP